MNANINETTENKGKRSFKTRPYKYEDPEILKQKIENYFKYEDENPLIKNDFIRSGEQAGTIVTIPIQSPYTHEGLCIALDISRETYFKIINRNDKFAHVNEEIIELFTYAHERIRNQQIKGAVGNLFNSNIVARYNNLKEQTDITSNDETITAINISFASPDDEE